jgi:hypothetical protein
MVADQELQAELLSDRSAKKKKKNENIKLCGNFTHLEIVVPEPTEHY